MILNTAREEVTPPKFIYFMTDRMINPEKASKTMINCVAEN